MSTQPKPYAFQPDGEPSELCLRTRVQFLECVSRIKPEVLADLWNRAFPKFKIAVLKQFAPKITEDIEDIATYVEEKFQKHLQDENSPYRHQLYQKLEEAIATSAHRANAPLHEQPELSAKIYSVYSQYRASFQEAVIVTLIQNKLTKVSASDPIANYFSSYSAIKERKNCQDLATVIRQWSEAWNLNEEWCRDQAVRTLREWLSHPQLSSVPFFSTPEAMQRTGWVSASHDLLWYAIGSRVNVDIAVYGSGGPPQLDFVRQNYKFSRPGFNRLRESQRAYKRRMSAEFELYASELRRGALLRVVNVEDKDSKPEIEPYSELVKHFNRILTAHIKSNLYSTEESFLELKKVKQKRSLPSHIRWSVDFHVPSQKTLDAIVEFEDYCVSVTEVLASANPKGFTREELCRQFRSVGVSDGGLDQALSLLVERGVVIITNETPLSRVMGKIRTEGRDDLVRPFADVEHEQRAMTEIRQRLDADYANGGYVVVRYCKNAEKEAREAPDRSVVSRAVNDVLNLIGLKNNAGARRNRPQGVRVGTDGDNQA